MSMHESGLILMCPHVMVQTRMSFVVLSVKQSLNKAVEHPSLRWVIIHYGLNGPMCLCSLGCVTRISGNVRALLSLINLPVKKVS